MEVEKLWACKTACSVCARVSVYLSVIHLFLPPAYPLLFLALISAGVLLVALFYCCCQSTCFNFSFSTSPSFFSHIFFVPIARFLISLCRCVWQVASWIKQAVLIPYRGSEWIMISMIGDRIIQKTNGSERGGFHFLNMLASHPALTVSLWWPIIIQCYNHDE